MAKFTYKEIKEIIAATPAELKEKSTSDLGILTDVGYFRPAAANWSYQVKATVHNGRAVLVVFVFGWSK